MVTELFHGYLRLKNFPLDESSIFSTYQDAYNYAASNQTAYAGQVIAVVNIGDRDVSIYNLVFPPAGSEINLELQGIASGIGAIRFVNGEAPNEDGEVVIDGTHIQVSSTDTRTVAEVLALFEGLTITEDEFIFDRTINAERLTGLATAQIELLTDAINLEYFNTYLADSEKAEVRTVQAILDNTGRAYDVQHWDFQIGDIITKVVVKITEAYSSTNITLTIGSTEIMNAEYIFEDAIGDYIYEPNIELTETGTMLTELSAASITGAATVYIEYTRDLYE